jgi:hypothetical protein
MQPHGAQWKPNPQPSRTNVMPEALGCGRTDENGEACALIENDDASTPQVRTNDNLLNIDKTSLLIAFLTIALRLLAMEAHDDDFGIEPGRLAWIYLRMVDCFSGMPA